MLRERIRHDRVREDILLDAVPYVEQKYSPGFRTTLCLAVGNRAVGKEHRAKLATHEIERRIFKRQRHRIRLTPCDAAVGDLSRCGVIEHRLVEVGDDIARAGGQFWRQGAGDDAGARGGFQNGARRQAPLPAVRWSAA